MWRNLAVEIWSVQLSKTYPNPYRTFFQEMFVCHKIFSVVNSKPISTQADLKEKGASP